MSGKTIKRRDFLKVSATALGAVVAAGCGATPSATPEAAVTVAQTVEVVGDVVKPVKIGVIQPMTGSNAVYGEGQKLAYEYAIDKVNSEGGIKSLGGAKLEFILADHQGKQEVAISEVERLIQQENVSVVAGASLSGIVVAATTATERLEVPFVVDVPAAAAITERGLKYVFRTNINGRTYGKTLVQLIQYLNENGQDIKKIALVYPDTEAARSFLGSVADEAGPAGLEIVFNDAFPAETQDFTTILTKVKVTEPDVIATNDYIPSGAIQFVQQAADINLNPKLFISANGTAEFPSFSEGIGTLKDGYAVMVQWNADVKGAPELNADFKAKKGVDMSGHLALGMQAVYAIAEALELAASYDPKVIRDALAKVRIDPGPRLVVPFSHVQYDETGQNSGARCIVVQYQGDKKYTVYPSEVATREILVPFDYWTSK